MTGCKHSIWKILSAAAILALISPRLTLSGETDFSAPVDYLVEGNAVVTVSADFDGQNGPDLAVAHAPANVSIFFNNGDGTFDLAQVITVPPLRTGKSIIATADMDGVNGPDLVATEFDTKSLAVYLNDGSGRFLGPRKLFLGPEAYIHTPSIGDFDRRNGPDVVVVQGDFSEPGLNRMFIAFNRGDGSLGSPVEYPLGLLGVHETGVGDFDGGLGEDIVISNRDHGNVFVYLNLGDGSFAPPMAIAAGGSGPEGVVSVDVDRRNGQDIVVGIYWNRVGVLLNRGDGTFDPGVGYDVGNKTIGVDAADFDRDGDIDVVASRFAETSLAYLENRGDGTFEDYSSIEIGQGKHRVIAKDVDHLNGPDVVASGIVYESGPGYASVILNQQVQDRLIVPAVPGATFEVYVDEASPTYPIGWHDYASPDFVSRTTDPLGPFSGIPVQFRGVLSGGQDLVARYRLEFDQPVVIDTVSIQGAAWRDDVIRLLDEDMSILATADAAVGGNPFQSVLIKAPRTEGQVFYLEEFNSDTDWRYRSSILVNLLPSDAEVEVAVRTLPYWKEVGQLDVSTETAMFVTVFSTHTLDARLILFHTIEINGLPYSAMRGPSFVDQDRDGLADYAVWFKLNRMPKLDCGEYEQAFTAMTSDHRNLVGQLRYKVVGCTP